MVHSKSKTLRYSIGRDSDSEMSTQDAQWALHNEQASRARSRRSTARFFRALLEITGMSARRRNGRFAYEYHVAPADDESEPIFKTQPSRKRLRRSIVRMLRIIGIGLPLLTVMVFGILHIVLVICAGWSSPIWDVHQYGAYLLNGRKLNHHGQEQSVLSTELTRDVLPIPCHSHNDYWRRVPLFDAISVGCTSVEADVWLFDRDDKLYVGHNTASLTPDRTLTKMYVDPLLQLLVKMNNKTGVNNAAPSGVFDQDLEQTLVFMIDFKTNGAVLFPEVQRQLEPLRQKNYLSYWNGNEFVSRAVTVVGTGNTPFDLVIQNTTYRDMFFDAPLDELWEPVSGDDHDGSDAVTTSAGIRPSAGQGQTGTENITSTMAFNTSTSYYASVSLASSIGRPWFGKFSQKQLELIRGQIRGARLRGLKTRYWDAPSWPTSLRNYIWQVLLDEGSDILSVDDLRAAAALDWRDTRHRWFDAR